jgi:hypothetical protein
MSKKEIIIPIIIVVLSIAFALISLAVILTKGKSKKWINRKMKIGALLLTLNAFTPGSAQEIEVSCYDIAEENLMLLKDNKTELTFNANSPKIVEAYIDYRIGDEYSFCVFDAENNKIQDGKIEAADGKFDKWKEDIEITLKSHLKAGRYFLFLFDVAVNEQTVNNHKMKIQVDIVDE